MKKQLLLIFFIVSLALDSKSMNVYQAMLVDDACNEGIGFIEVDVIGGVAPYTFQWSAGTVSTPLTGLSRISNLTAGTYTVTVYDMAGDSATNSFTVLNYSTLDRFGLLNYIFTAVDPISQSYVGHPCSGQSNGTMFGRLELTGGASPFTAPGIINIFNPLTGQMNLNAFAGINNGPNGEYIQVFNLTHGDQFTIELSDAMGCLGTFSDVMAGPDNFSSNVVTTLPACNGQANGTALVSYNGSNGWPMDVMLYDSASNALVANVTLGFTPFTISSNLLTGTYRINLAYEATISTCDTNYYITVADAGTNCGTINGKIYVDTIHNCVIDASEPGLPSQIVRLIPGPYYATTDANGDFSFNVPYGTYNLSQVIQNYYGYVQNYFPVCNPVAAIINGVTTTATRNIGDSTNAQFDLSIGVTASAARPGFNLHYDVLVKNNSFITGAAPVVTFTIDPSLVFVSCSHLYTDLGGGVYTVQFGAMAAFQQSLVRFYFTVPSSNAIGTNLAATASVTDVISETNVTNNSKTYSQIIVGSFDPNDKSVFPSRNASNTYFVDIDSVLSYTIRFQNTGTDTAFNVHIVDTLSQWLDINSLNIEAASHPMTWKLKGTGVLEFNFANILLPDSNTNEAASHGSVTYSIRPINNVPLTTLIANTAAIYFDFNQAVNTNTITSYVDITTHVNELNSENAVSIIPNPSSNFITVLISDQLKSDACTLRIFNLQGQEVKRVNDVNNHSTISLEQLSSGCYFYRLEKDGRMIEHSQGKIILNK